MLGCARCGGSMFKGGDQYGTYLICLMCGVYVEDVKPEGKRREIERRHPAHYGPRKREGGTE